MRKIFLCTILMVLTSALFAEDLIVTTSDKTIKAKIEEVSDTEVRYKEFDNQEGPTFIIKTNEISTIVFNNGTAKNFQSDKSTNSHQTTSEYLILQPVKKVGSHLECDGKVMTGSEFLSIAQHNCPEAFELRNKGRNQLAIGGTLAVCGIGLGFVCLFSHDPAYVIASGCVAIPCLISSIPLIACGAHKMDKAIGVYNQSCAKRTSASEFRFNLKSDGISLSYNF